MKLNYLKNLLITLIVLLFSSSINAQYQIPEYAQNYDSDQVTVYSFDIGGGHHVVADQTARDNISEPKRQIGMLVTFEQLGSWRTERFQGLTTLDASWQDDNNWLLLLDSLNGGGGSTDTLFHADTKEWLANGDTIPKADSNRTVQSGDTIKINNTISGYIANKSGDGMVIRNSDAQIEFSNFEGDILALRANDDGDYINIRNNLIDITSNYVSLKWDGDSIYIVGDRLAWKSEIGTGVPDSLLVSYKDTLTLDGDTLRGARITAKIKAYFGDMFLGRQADFDSILVGKVIFADGSGSIDGVDTSGYFSIPSLQTDTFRLGSSAPVDTLYPLKHAVENESFDSVNIGGYVIRFNKSEGVHEFYTAKEGVVWQGALEDLVEVYNDKAVTLTNGTPFFFDGVNGDSIATAGIASANNRGAIGFQGLITGDILPNDWGYGAVRGQVRSRNTVGLSQEGATFLSADSSLTNDKPGYPNKVVVVGGVIKVGTDGVVYLSPSLALQRTLGSKSYSFTTQGIGAGTYYKGGYYDESTTDANLTQASTTITFGSANAAKSAHPFIVCGGAGTVNSGTIGIEVEGTYIDDEGIRIAGYKDTILTDITNVSLNEYFEASKFSGTVTYRLIVTSGTPTTYTFDFNYGYAKYEDIGNRDFYIFGVECVGLAAATDVLFNVELLHHKTTGWTYAATGFEAGDGNIAEWATDLGTESNLINGEDFSWKRTNLNQFIDGNGSEGVLLRITTGSNNSVQSMDIHISGAIEDE